MELRNCAREAFSLCQPERKVDAVEALWRHLGTIELDCEADLAADIQPGRLPRPRLVDPQHVPRRSPYTAAGHAALMHAIAHIEFNAINLALDAVWRFGGMPPQYYRDWMGVAWEEAQHFSMVRLHLQDLGYEYGDFEAHDGLWTLCDKTRGDITARMALVPRTLEARALDATPIIQTKLKKVGSANALAGVAILDVILREEVGHVAIGNHWYRWLCERNGLGQASYYENVVTQYGAPRPRPPFNLTARRLAGFSDSEIEALSQQASAAK